ncbi:malonate decarboxylase subunit epsilon, partial [Pseudomonas aeruginosa]|nr:malonate decarboxylase subunit epsilon [Pseudomonas aeruginosa]
MSTLFVYPGQGAQRPGMLAALPDEPVVRDCLAQAADCLGQAPAELDSAEALRGTRAVQLCLLIAGVAASRLLEQRGHRPGLVARPGPGPPRGGGGAPARGWGPAPG